MTREAAEEVASPSPVLQARSDPEESTQGALSAATKAAQKRDNVQICRISVSEGADLDALVRVMEGFFDLKYGPVH